MPALTLLVLLAALAQPAPSQPAPAAPAAPPLATPTSPAPTGPGLPGSPALPPTGPLAALIKTCTPDWLKFCQSPPATTAETVQACFREHFDGLSEPCQSGIMAMIGGAGPAA